MRMTTAVLVLTIMQGIASAGDRVCETNSLPQALQQTLANKFGAWKIQEPSTLGSYAQRRWKEEPPFSCPGIASGWFSDDRKSYAVLLVPKVTQRGRASYKLLLFSDSAEPEDNPPKVLEADSEGAGNIFIRAISMKAVFTPQSIKDFGVKARDGIVVIDSGENEYEADAYFWAGRAFRREPIDY